MKGVKEINTFILSAYINIARQFLLKEGFFEHTLYSTIPYKLENTDIFQVRDNLFLRYGTEPDIWKIGEQFDKLFFIGSLFRNEKKLTEIHNYEFKIIDFYMKDGSIRGIINIFIRLLEEIEKNIQRER